MHACACMYVCMSVCGKYEGLYVRRHACTCVRTTLTPTPTHRNIRAFGCEASHGLVRLAFFFGRGLVLRFALRAITHTHTSTRTKLYMHICMYMARQPPPYTDTPAGPQDLVRPSLGHLVGGEQVGEEFRLLLLFRTRLGRHTLGATAAAVELGATRLQRV